MGIIKNPDARLTNVVGVRLDGQAVPPSGDFALLEAAIIATCVYDPGGNCLYANEAWERLWGLPRAVALRQNILEDASIVGAENIPAVRRAFAGVRTELPVRDHAQADTRSSRKVRTHLAPFETPRGTLLIARFEDVTDRDADAQTRSAVLRALSDMGLGIVALEGTRIVWANDAYEKMTGYSLAELTSPDFSVARLSTTSTAEEIERRMSERVVGLHQDLRRVVDILRKDGTRLRVEATSRTTERGPPPKVVSVLRVVEA